MSLDDLLPPEILDKHLGDTEEEVTPSPAVESEEPEDEAEETLDEEESDAEDEETDDEDAGGEEPDDAEDEEESEDEDDESDDDEEEEDDEDSESFLPKFDRKKIEQDPELSKAYKHMQAAFTKKMMEASDSVRQAEEVLEEVKQFEATLADPKGAEEFLLNVALNRPEVFQNAYERAVALLEDDEEKDSYLKEQQLKVREKELERQEREAQARAQEARVEQIETSTRRLAAKMGLDTEDVEIAEQFVANRILENRARTGKADVSDDEIREAVSAAKKFVERKAQKVQSVTKRQLLKEREEQVKAKAKLAKRPRAPKAGKSPAPRPKREEITAPPGVDPLDFGIDKLLEGAD